MNCQNCGRKIKRGYKWNGKLLGIRCYTAVNPYYTDPAQAVYNAAQAALDGDFSALAVLPRVWHSPLRNEHNHKEADIARQLTDRQVDHPAHGIYAGLPTAYHLATRVHSHGVERKLDNIFSVGEYLRVAGRR